MWRRQMYVAKGCFYGKNDRDEDCRLFCAETSFHIFLAVLFFPSSVFTSCSPHLISALGNDCSKYYEIMKHNTQEEFLA